jgi:hypothetical protein
MRRTDIASPVVRRVLTSLGVRVRPVDCLDGRVVRLVGRRITTEPAEVLRELRGRGLPVSSSYVTPMNPWVKGLSGPAPSAGSRPFPDDAAGAGVAVAVIDSGIVGVARTDGWLDSVSRQDNVDPPAEVLDAGAGHGTFVAGVLQQVAPGADIRVYRAVDSDGIGSETGVACAMLRAAAEGASILNLSLGTSTVDDEAPVAMSVAMELLAERHPDVLVVAAAGNDGDTRPCWPAALPGVVAVAGLTASGDASTWSNRGGWVTCSSVGEGVVSTFVPGRKAEVTFGADPWACWTGTSFAAPQVAGLVARHGDLRPRAALDRVLAGAPTVPGFGATVRALPGT